VRHESDGLVVCRDGLIEAVGPYHDLRRELPADVPIADYSGCIISAGLIDAHIHYVQTGIIAAPGKRLLDWVDDYVYPDEEAFADEVHARAIASFFCDTLLRSGTTTACIYCAVYPNRNARSRSLEETLIILMTLGDEWAVRATYVGGALAHERPSHAS
jgi:guanine deaminase